MIRRVPFWYWVGGLVLAGLAIYLVRDVLLPFVVGIGVAYLLNPVVNRLARYGVPRWFGATLVGGSFLVAAALALVILIPILIDQSIDLAERAPDILDAIRRRLESFSETIRERLSPEDLDRIRGFVGRGVSLVAGWVAGMAGGLLGSGLAVFNALSLIFITPVVGFYLLRDWDRIVAFFDSHLPVAHAETIRIQAQRIDHRLAGFVRGQFAVCLVLGVLYAVALSVAGLEFGLVIGMFAGLVSFVPYLGSISGLLLSTGVALFQFPDWYSVGIVVAIFLVGQAIEGNVLTPLLVGDRVGLHPVWIIFALLVGGALFGFVGLLLAVPAAAAIGVLIRFALDRYRHSQYFDDPTPGP